MDLQSRLDNLYGHDEDKASHKVRLEQLKYFLNNNINPLDSSAAKFTTRFMEQSIYLFLPLLIIVLAGDLVSGEASAGKAVEFKVLEENYLSSLKELFKTIRTTNANTRIVFIGLYLIPMRKPARSPKTLSWLIPGTMILNNWWKQMQTLFLSLPMTSLNLI